MATGNLAKEVFLTPPLSIAGCQLWLDGADSTTITGTSSVTAWNDKSINANNATVYNSAVGSPVAPLYSTNSINGLSAITMSGTSYFQGATNVNGTTLTCFFIGNCVYGTGGSSQQRILGLGVTGLDDYSSTLRPIPLSVISAGTQLLTYRNANMASATVVSGTNFIGCCLFDGTTNYMYKNGVLGTQTASSGTFTTSIYGVGSDAGTQFNGATASLGTNCLVGKIGELIVFNTALTTLQQQQVEGYLAWKWGLQGSLPSSHPYASSSLYQIQTVPISRGLPLKVTSSTYFSPISTAGCQVWFDGADPLGTGIPPANSATISIWTDKSGNNYNATPSSGRIAGTFSSASNCVYFGSSSVGYQTSYPANPTNETMFIVASINSPANVNNNTIIGGQGGARSFGFGYSGTGGTGYSSYLNNEVAWQSSSIAGPPTGTTALITGTVTTTTSVAVALNGSSFTTGSISAWSGGTTTYLGVDTTNTAYYYVGFVMEILFYNSVLSDTQRKQVEGYLAWKWGLQSSLVTTHPNSTRAYVPFPFPTSIPVASTKIWSPTRISGTQLWLDGADVSSMTVSGTSVTQWNDKSGNANNATQSTGAYQPTYSLSNVYFNGSTYMNLPNGTLPSGNSGYSVFFVIKYISGNFILGAGITSNNQATFIGANTTNIFDAWYNVDAGAGSTFSLPNTTFIGQSIYTQNVYRQLYVTGSLTQTQPSSNRACSSLYNAIGGFLNQNTFGVFYCNEILYYNTGITQTQRQQVEGYLAWKWGLVTSLPAGHPYINFPPSP